MFERPPIKVKQADDKIVIKFPSSYWSIIFHLIIFAIIVAQTFFIAAPLEARIFSYLFFAIMLSNIVMSYLRNLTIDTRSETITYFSYFRSTFDFRDIEYMQSIVDNRFEHDSYYLQITLKNKTIKIHTQSDKQSTELYREIAMRTSYAKRY